MADIALVTLIYNRKNYLEEALESAFKQTLDKSKWVHIIIDNGSTDGSGDIAKRFCENNKYINSMFITLSKNLGIQGGHNYVLNDIIPKHFPEARIFSLLESDDMLTPDCLEEVYKMFSEHSYIGETYSDFKCINGNGQTIFEVYPGKAHIMPNQFTIDGIKAHMNNFEHNVAGHQRSYSIKALKEIGGFDKSFELANDFSTYGKILDGGYPVVKIEKCLYIWREHSNAASINRQKQIQEAKEITKYYKDKWIMERKI